MGAGRGVLLETDGREWGPIATAAAIADAVRTRADPDDAAGRAEPYGLLLFGNEAADTGDYQVPVRVAHALSLPCVTGIKHLGISETADRAVARREHGSSEEVFDLPLPAVVSVKEGINLPRYPSLPGRLRAKRAVIERLRPEYRAEGMAKQALRVPAGQAKRAEVLGTGPDAVPAMIRLFEELGVLP